MKSAFGAALWMCLIASLAFAQERNLDSFIDGMAKDAAAAIARGGAKAVAVVELGTTARRTGGELGSLGKYIASSLQSRLASLAGGSYAVVDRMNLEKVLREQELQLSGLVEGKAAARIGSILACDALLTGSIELLASLVVVNLDLVNVASGIVLGSAQRRIPITTDVKALLGIDYEDGDIVREIVPAGSDFPYYLRVVSREGYKREYYADGRRYIRANPNEEYAIEIENRTDRAVGVALFVDGINTAFMKRETPAQGTKWIVDAKGKVLIEGWQLDAAEARRFVFAGKDESLAAKRGFSDEVGLISAAFFNQQESLTRGGQMAGTKIGDSFGSPVKKVEIRLENSPAVIFNIWYDYENGLLAKGITTER